MPHVPIEAFKAQVLKIDTVYQFQTQIVVPLLDELLKKSTDGLNWNGAENLKKGENYLFVSTHRDIALDSALMDYVLLKEGFDTAEIAIGDNLMKIPWIVDLVKLNKTFIVKRSLPKEKKVEGSIQLSSYINYSIQEKKESIWIAHKAGRSKDGNDRTNPSLIKMFNLAGKEEAVIDNLLNLKICPVSISYEYNPCDALTIPELMTIAKGDVYEKQPMEDLMQMGQGIEGKKGKVGVSFGRPLKELIANEDLPANRNELFARVAQLIDEEIHRTYQLMESNYIAYDTLEGGSQFSDQYTEEGRLAFISYMDKRLEDVEGEEDIKKQTFLKMYAYPVMNRLAVEK